MAGRHRKPSPLHRAHYRGRHRKPPSRAATVVPSIVAVAAIAAGGVAFGHSLASGQPPRVAAGTVVPQVTTPAVTAAPVVTSAPTTPPAPRVKRTSAGAPAAGGQNGPAALVVTDRGGGCYVEVKTVAGKLLVRRILHRGQRVTVREHAVRVVLGNAGAAWVSLDGHDAHRAGRAGKVLQFRVR